MGIDYILSSSYITEKARVPIDWEMSSYATAVVTWTFGHIKEESINQNEI